MGVNEDNVVQNKIQLRKKLAQICSDFQQAILIEDFIQGREFSVGFLGSKGRQFEVLPILEKDFTQFPADVGNVFGQRAKTTYDDLKHYVCPAQISSELVERILHELISVQMIMMTSFF